jgi:hypothetical protein
MVLATDATTWIGVSRNPRRDAGQAAGGKGEREEDVVGCERRMRFLVAYAMMNRATRVKVARGPGRWDHYNT